MERSIPPFFSSSLSYWDFKEGLPSSFSYDMYVHTHMYTDTLPSSFDY